MGEHLHDHLIIPTTNFSKLPMGEADCSEDGLHSQVYFSCELPSPPCMPTHPSSSAKGDINGNGGGNGDDAGTDATPNPLPSAVVGLVFSDGGGFSQNLQFAVRLPLTQQGLLWAVFRAVTLTLYRVVTCLPPIIRVLRSTRGALLAVTTVKSRGTVRLASADAAAPPVIDPVYMSHPQDQQAACAVWSTVRQAKRETPTGKAVFGSELLPGKMCVPSVAAQVFMLLL